MVAITNTTSLTFLKESIDATLSEAEASLEAFAEERDEGTSLDRCGEAFHQLRGISQTLELCCAAVVVDRTGLGLGVSHRDRVARPSPRSAVGGHPAVMVCVEIKSSTRLQCARN